MKHTKVVMNDDCSECKSAGLIEDNKDDHLSRPYINVWYHHPDQNTKALKLFKRCDKSDEMYEALKELFEYGIIISDETHAKIGTSTELVIKIESILKEIDNETN